jgi:hypothetical protein
MTLTRTCRRIMIATLVVVTVAVLASLYGRPFQSDRFYAFLELHSAARQMVRPVFVLAGKQTEFDRRMMQAFFNCIIEDAHLVPQDDKFRAHGLSNPGAGQLGSDD